jgi:proteic killer suppression protein/toxin YoeB
MARKKGIDITKTIKKRYEQLKAAETFGEYLLTGLGKPHPLSSNRDHLYGINITGNIRLIVEPVSKIFD